MRALRLRVLRPGGPPEAAVWPGDDDPRAVHMAIRDAGLVVAVATVLPEPHPTDPDPGDWRIRGMATAPERRGEGHGRALVAACAEAAHEAGAERLWCHARTGAVRLYERAGFVAETEPFEVEGIGPHVRMSRPSGVGSPHGQHTKGSDPS